MSPSEDGFTMVELLVSIAVMGVIGAGITGGIILALKTTDTTRDRVSQSADGQIASTYFITDVQGASTVSVVPADVYNCGGTPPAGNSPAPLIRIRWTDPGAPVVGTTTTTSPGVAKEASYIVETVAGERRLTRRLCSGSSPVLAIPLARYLSTTGTPASVACVPSCSGRPQTVTLTITELDGTTFQFKGVVRLPATTTTT